jgi:hypothetical protein
VGGVSALVGHDSGNSRQVRGHGLGKEKCGNKKVL